jgi:hypothetical protein
LRQRDEDRLGNFLRRVGISGLAQGGVINHARVTVRQRAESLFGIARGVIIEQLPVVHVLVGLIIQYVTPGQPER